MPQESPSDPSSSPPHAHLAQCGRDLAPGSREIAQPEVERGAGQLGVFVIWEKGRWAEDRILADLNDRFDVLHVDDVHWSQSLVTRNYRRFYSDIEVRGTAHLEKQRAGRFLAVFVLDRTPLIEARVTARGLRLQLPVPRRQADRAGVDIGLRVLAGHLAVRGVAPGSRVLIALPNTPATIVAGLALNALGATSVEVSREWSAEALGDIVTRSGVRQAFVWARDASRWSSALAGSLIDHIWVVHPDVLPDTFADGIGGIPASLLREDGDVDPDLDEAPPPPRPELSPDWAALVLYTSGSTGRPLGVVQTFRNIEANTRSIVEYLRLTAADRALVTLPLYYCYGRSVLQTHLYAGGSLVLDNRMAFPRRVLEHLAAEGCTGFAGVPLTFEVIRRQVDVSTITFDRLRYLTQAGGAMAPDTIAWVRGAFRPAQLFVMYGQTEATARLSYLPPERADDKAGSIGIPIPGVELRVMDERGAEAQPGEVGELVARGDNVTPGYLDEPEQTAAILRDGWLWTGDLAERDADGFLYHRGRAKEILKIGGHRVSPMEIEHVISRHQDVADVAVVGVKDRLMGQVPTAVVVARAGAMLTEPDVLRFCRERLPAYQVPVAVVLAESLPRNEAGKLLRAELAALCGAR